MLVIIIKFKLKLIYHSHLVNRGIDMKEYIKPEIIDEEIELEDIIAESKLGDSISESFDEENSDKTPFPW